MDFAGLGHLCIRGLLRVPEPLATRIESYFLSTIHALLTSHASVHKVR
jgi:hypothetical protein